MKCHACLCIMMPRSHSHDQEGFTRNGSRYQTDIVEIWNFVSVVTKSRRISAAGADSKLMLASSRTGESLTKVSTGSLFQVGRGLIHCASCSTCLYSSQLSAKGRIRKNKIHTHHIFSIWFWNTCQLSTSPLAHYAHQSFHSAAQMYTCSPSPHPPQYILWLWTSDFE